MLLRLKCITLPCKKFQLHLVQYIEFQPCGPFHHQQLKYLRLYQIFTLLWACNLGQNSWNKVKESSETRQDYKNLYLLLDPFWLILPVSFLKGRLGTWLYLQPKLKFFPYFSDDSSFLKNPCFGWKKKVPWKTSNNQNWKLSKSIFGLDQIFYGIGLFCIFIKDWRKTLKLQNISKNWSLGETGTTYDQKLVCSD